MSKPCCISMHKSTLHTCSSVTEQHYAEVTHSISTLSLFRAGWLFDSADPAHEHTRAAHSGMPVGPSGTRAGTCSKPIACSFTFPPSPPVHFPLSPPPSCQASWLGAPAAPAASLPLRRTTAVHCSQPAAAAPTTA